VARRSSSIAPTSIRAISPEGAEEGAVPRTLTILFPDGRTEYWLTTRVFKAGDKLQRDGKSWIVTGIGGHESDVDDRHTTVTLRPDEGEVSRPSRASVDTEEAGGVVEAHSFALRPGWAEKFGFAPVHAYVHFGDAGARVIAVFDPLVPGERLAGFGKWVIREVKSRFKKVDGIETQCEVWVERVDDE
jgi:hypothetical protein